MRPGRFGPFVRRLMLAPLAGRTFMMTAHQWVCVKRAWGLPTRDLEYRLAVRLLDQESPLDREILETLVGRPATYGELRPLLEGKNDNVLTKGLRRLRDNGTIKQGIDLATKGHRYALTELGKLVLFRMHEMVPYWASIAAYERGLKAPA